METVTVYRFQTWDAGSDGMRVSQRMGTLNGIARVNGLPLMTTGIEVDAAAIGAEVFGMTARGYRTGWRGASIPVEDLRESRSGRDAGRDDRDPLSLDLSL